MLMGSGLWLPDEKPLQWAFMNELRRTAAVQRGVAEGKSPAEIARKHGATWQQVYRVAAALSLVVEDEGWKVDCA